MPYQVKPEPPVESLHLATMQAMFDTHKMLHDFGYRGSLSTTTSVDAETEAVTESARFDMVLQDSVPISAALGNVILYRVAPAPAVVACMTFDEFTATYEAAP